LSRYNSSLLDGVHQVEQLMGEAQAASGWGKRPDEDDREWARRCLAMARKMCAPSVRRRKKI
jgi:hypothetical protein